MKTNAGRGFKKMPSKRSRHAALASVGLAGLLLSGCGGLGADDVEVNLPFVGDVMRKSKTKEEKVAARGTLVMPPKVDTLPEPVDGKTAAAAGNGVESWPVDPDLKAKSDAQMAEEQKRRIEREGDWKDEMPKTGNGLEEFEKKTQWSKRQTGVIDKLLNDKSAEDKSEQ
jgi:hypothetical protein